MSILEDAPALDAIHSFKATVKDGQVFVTANPKSTLKDNKARPPKLSTDDEVAPGRGVVIVGGGQSGLDVAARLKHLDVPALIVEKQPRIGDQWRTRYAALCLHDPVCEWSFPYSHMRRCTNRGLSIPSST